MEEGRGPVRQRTRRIDGRGLSWGCLGLARLGRAWHGAAWRGVAPVGITSKGITGRTNDKHDPTSAMIAGWGRTAFLSSFGGSVSYSDGPP